MPPNTSPSTSAQPTTSAKPLQTLLKALISPCGLLLTFIAVAITLVSFVRLSSQGYDGLELARWTAVKEFHKECENHQDKPNFTSDCEKALRTPLSPPPNLKSPPNDWHPPERIENAGSTPSTFATVLLVVSVCYAYIVLFSFFANGGDRQLAEKKAEFFLKFERVPSWVVWVLFTSYCVACALKYLCTSIANALVFIYRLRRGK